jgi:inner membrane protein
LLPEYLKIEGEIVPEKLKRGIYEVVVYTSDISVTGDFELTKLFDQTDLKEIRYDQSYITIGLSDLRGIKNELDFSWDGQSAAVKPGTKLSNIAYSGITVELPDEGPDNEKSHKFSFKLKLRGSQNLSFVPLGSTTEVEISSDWDAPSFNGNFLPDWRNIDKDGFEARWKIFQLNRNLPQSWIDSDMSGKMNEAAFGFDLLLPLDDYQKSMRSAKYAGMTIALTFLVFFLVEVLNKRKIHPFQYILVGLALCIFYILLVSISEHTNFNFAYGISAFSIILMITMYSLSVFKKKMLSLLLIIILVGIYGFLYVTLQLADYALLMGSIGLVVILGITMYFTRKINWYKLNIEAD